MAYNLLINGVFLGVKSPTDPNFLGHPSSFFFMAQLSRRQVHHQFWAKCTASFVAACGTLTAAILEPSCGYAGHQICDLLWVFEKRWNKHAHKDTVNITMEVRKSCRISI